jgi:nitroreductase
MDIKAKVRSFIPKFIKSKVREFRFYMVSRSCYRYDAARFIKYSNAFYQFDNFEKLIGIIIAEYHVIEKGLTMPEPNLGFGVEIMKSLIKHCDLYSAQICNKDSKHFFHAIGVIAEYKLFHEKKQFPLDEFLLQSINGILSDFGQVNASRQIVMNNVDYFKNTYSSFEDFSNSRHSLRNFSGSVELSLIEKAVKLAQNAPSSCNRQPARIYIVQNKILMKKILAIQDGNRGFGHLADKLIILTSELGGYLGLRERNDVYINGGIYAMNLLYALHFYKIGACALNWCSLPDKDREFRKLCNIKPSENIILIIACGRVLEKFQLTCSYRNDYQNILKIL